MNAPPSPAASAAPVLRFRDVTRVYRRAGQQVRALDGVTLDIHAGEFVVVMGPSGSGKSTFLNLAGALDTPTAGAVEADGVSLASLDDDGLTHLRRERTGFVFQFFNLLPTLDALENVMLPALLAGRPAAELAPRARALLDRVGLAARHAHRPDQLSGGEMQRVAVARALVHAPRLVLADEPTGNLDSATGAEVLTLLRDAAAERGVAVVMVTHDPRAAALGSRLVTLVDGRVRSDGPPAAAPP